MSAEALAFFLLDERMSDGVLLPTRYLTATEDSLTAAPWCLSFFLSHAIDCPVFKMAFGSLRISIADPFLLFSRLLPLPPCAFRFEQLVTGTSNVIPGPGQIVVRGP